MSTDVRSLRAWACVVSLVVLALFGRAEGSQGHGWISREPSTLSPTDVQAPPNEVNLWAGRRTPKSLDRWGNLINDLSSVVQPTSYVALIPARTELSFVDQNGSRIESAQVDVFLDHHADTYVRNYRATPDRTLVTEARGIAILPGDALNTIAPTALGPAKPQVIILGVRTPSARGFTFLPVHTLNMLYFRGARERGELQLRVMLHRW